MGVFTSTRKIICENSRGFKLEFGYSFPFFLKDYSGIHEYSGTVSTVKSAFGVGEIYVGTSVNSRNISLIVALKDDILLQQRRNQIYNIFPLNDKGILYFYEGKLERKINYYVENIAPVRVGNHIYFTVSLKCPNPYFSDTKESIVTLNNWNKLLEFPLEIIDDTGLEFGTKNENTTLEINNNSHINYGLTVVFTANGKVINPCLTNKLTGETMKINYTLSANEKIVIKTYIDEKSIVHINQNGNETDIINFLVFGTKFLQAINGNNRFISSADSGQENLDTSISFYNYYEAI